MFCSSFTSSQLTQMPLLCFSLLASVILTEGDGGLHPVSAHVFASRPMKRLSKRIDAFLNKGKLEPEKGGSGCLVGNINPFALIMLPVCTIKTVNHFKHHCCLFYLEWGTDVQKIPSFDADTAIIFKLKFSFTSPVFRNHLDSDSDLPFLLNSSFSTTAFLLVVFPSLHYNKHSHIFWCQQVKAGSSNIE